MTTPAEKSLGEIYDVTYDKCMSAQDEMRESAKGIPFAPVLEEVVAIHFPSHDAVNESLRRQLAEYDQMRNDLTTALLKIQELQHLMVHDPIKERLAKAINGTARRMYAGKLCWCKCSGYMCIDDLSCVGARKAIAAYEAERIKP